MLCSLYLFLQSVTRHIFDKALHMRLVWDQVEKELHVIFHREPQIFSSNTFIILGAIYDKSFLDLVEFILSPPPPKKKHFIIAYEVLTFISYRHSPFSFLSMITFLYQISFSYQIFLSSSFFLSIFH